MPTWMSSQQRYQWQIVLELKLRKMHGDAFQEFFSAVMERAHGTDFIRARALGNLGDRGCDGYLRATGQLYQCYGKHQDTPVRSATVVGKIAADYATAARELAHIMREWHFVHNLFDGLPVAAIEKIEELGRANGAHRFGVIGPAGFEDRVFALDERHIDALLGPVATAEDGMNMRVEEVAHLMAAVIAGMDEPPFADARPNEPPNDKLELNGIRGHWRSMLRNAAGNAGIVAAYVRQHHDPEIGKRVAKVFSTRYAELDAERLPPGTILTKLYEGITGIGSVPPERQVAAQALLAYLFEACDIFKDRPAGAIP